METYYPVELTEHDLEQMASIEALALARRALLLREFAGALSIARMSAAGKESEAEKIAEALYTWLVAMPGHYRIADVAAALSLR